MKKLRYLSGIFTLGFLLISCDQGPIMEVRKQIPGANWERFNTMWFEYLNDDVEQSGDIILLVRYSGEVELNRLEIMGTIHAPSGEMRFREYMVHFRDPEKQMKGEVVQEEWKGQKVYEQQISIRKDFLFREEGRYRFEIENLSSKYDNPGIVSLGVRLVQREK